MKAAGFFEHAGSSARQPDVDRRAPCGRVAGADAVRRWPIDRLRQPRPTTMIDVRAVPPPDPPERSEPPRSALSSPPTDTDRPRPSDRDDHADRRPVDDAAASPRTTTIRPRHARAPSHAVCRRRCASKPAMRVALISSRLSRRPKSAPNDEGGRPAAAADRRRRPGDGGRAASSATSDAFCRSHQRHALARWRFQPATRRRPRRSESSNGDDRHLPDRGLTVIASPCRWLGRGWRRRAPALSCAHAFRNPPRPARYGPICVPSGLDAAAHRWIAGGARRPDPGHHPHRLLPRRARNIGRRERIIYGRKLAAPTAPTPRSWPTEEGAAEARRAAREKQRQFKKLDEQARIGSE